MLAMSMVNCALAAIGMTQMASARPINRNLMLVPAPDAEIRDELPRTASQETAPDSIGLRSNTQEEPLFRLETTECPSRDQSEQEQRDGWADQQNQDCKQITGALEAALYPVDDQIDDPPHDPRGREKQPHA